MGPDFTALFGPAARPNAKSNCEHAVAQLQVQHPKIWGSCGTPNSTAATPFCLQNNTLDFQNGSQGSPESAVIGKPTNKERGSAPNSKKYSYCIFHLNRLSALARCMGTQANRIVHLYEKAFSTHESTRFFESLLRGDCVFFPRSRLRAWA
jgi:hypothetical protein